MNRIARVHAADRWTGAQEPRTYAAPSPRVRDGGDDALLSRRKHHRQRYCSFTFLYGCRDAGLTFGEQKKNIGHRQSIRNNVMHPRSQPSEKGADELEVAVDEAIAACGGDMRSTIRALIVANDYLESEACELMAAVSHAYVRGRFRTYSG